MAQIGGFDGKALATGSFWSHVGKAKPNEWLLTVARIDEVGRPAQRTRRLALRSAPAMLYTCMLSRACSRASAVAPSLP